MSYWKAVLCFQYLETKIHTYIQGMLFRIWLGIQSRSL